MQNMKILIAGRFLVLLLAALALPGCSTAVKSGRVENTTAQHDAMTLVLNNKTGWQLEKMARSDGTLLSLQPKTAISLYFDGARIHGNSGCNSYFGGYRATAKDSRLVIGDIGFTMMACADAIMRQERRYLDLLQHAASYRGAGNSLQLLDEAGDVVLVFVVPDVMPLKETQWQLLSFHSGSGMLSNLYTGDIYAVFDNQGRLSGFSGCNRYYSSYSLKGKKLQLSPIITTRKNCLPEELMVTEAGYLAALDQVDGYQIRERQLTLFAADGRRLAVFKVAE